MGHLLSPFMTQASPPGSAVSPDMLLPDVSPDSIGVCIEGNSHHTATPTQQTPPPATPTLPKAPAVEKEVVTLSSTELEERIQLHLEARATEWLV